MERAVSADDDPRRPRAVDGRKVGVEPRVLHGARADVVLGADHRHVHAAKVKRVPEVTVSVAWHGVAARHGDAALAVRVRPVHLPHGHRRVRPIVLVVADAHHVGDAVCVRLDERVPVVPQVRVPNAVREVAGEQHKRSFGVLHHHPHRLRGSRVLPVDRAVVRAHVRERDERHVAAERRRCPEAPATSVHAPLARRNLVRVLGAGVQPFEQRRVDEARVAIARRRIVHHAQVARGVSDHTGARRLPRAVAVDPRVRHAVRRIAPRVPAEAHRRRPKLRGREAHLHDLVGVKAHAAGRRDQLRRRRLPRAGRAIAIVPEFKFAAHVEDAHANGQRGRCIHGECVKRRVPRRVRRVVLAHPVACFGSHRPRHGDLVAIGDKEGPHDKATVDGGCARRTRRKRTQLGEKQHMEHGHFHGQELRGCDDVWWRAINSTLPRTRRRRSVGALHSHPMYSALI
eukprot:Opistho-1_new@96666